MEYKGRKYYFTLDKKEIYSRGKYKCKFCGKEKIF